MAVVHPKKSLADIFSFLAPQRGGTAHPHVSRASQPTRPMMHISSALRWYPGQPVPRDQTNLRPRPIWRTPQCWRPLPADKALPSQRPALQEDHSKFSGLRLPRLRTRLAQV